MFHYTEKNAKILFNLENDMIRGKFDMYDMNGNITWWHWKANIS